MLRIKNIQSKNTLIKMAVIAVKGQSDLVSINGPSKRVKKDRYS